MHLNSNGVRNKNSQLAGGLYRRQAPESHRHRYAENTNMTKIDPPNWAKDELSKFIETAYENIFASYVNYKKAYDILSDINKCYRLIIDNLYNTPQWFAGFFLLRAHSSYLAAVRLALSGQTSETFMVLRGCLENSLYGLYLSQNPASQETWLKRHEDEESYKKVKNEFKIRDMIDKTLKSKDPKLCKIFEELYDRTIDYGAHPNERALSATLHKQEKDGIVKFDLNYLSGDSTELKHCIITTAEIGICSLGVLKIIYKERFEISGISDSLGLIKKNFKIFA